MSETNTSVATPLIYVKGTDADPVSGDKIDTLLSFKFSTAPKYEAVQYQGQMVPTQHLVGIEGSGSLEAKFDNAEDTLALLRTNSLSGAVTYITEVINPAATSGQVKSYRWAVVIGSINKDSPNAGLVSFSCDFTLSGSLPVAVMGS